MKNRLFLFLVGFLFSPFVFADGTRETAAINWLVSNTAVSTQTVTALPATAFSGRYRINIENLDTAYTVYIGTGSNLTVSNGWAINASSSTTNYLDIPLPAGSTVNALGQGNNVRATLDIRTIEYK